MLILTRRPREKVIIFDNEQGVNDKNKIEFIFLGIKGQQIRIGIKAPPNIAVHRDEIYNRILHEGIIELRDGNKL